MSGAERATVTVRVADSLRFLLRVRDRGAGQRQVLFDPDATIGHLVQAAGVPIPEVGAVRLDGGPAAIAARTAPGSVVEVLPVHRPEPVPDGGFLLDVGLGSLARRLRLLGLDAAWSADADDPELVARARAEDRVLLTQDRRLLMRRALGRAGEVRGALVRGSGTDTQLTDVLDRFAPALAPLTRCTACGATLEPVQKATVVDLLESGTRRTQDDFSRCPACGRIYWRGAHTRRIEAIVRAATGP